jgi:hypothetical protein
LILKTFLKIAGNRHELLPLMDGATVKLLQSRAPKVSPRDHGFLKGKKDRAELFPNLSPSQRQEFWQQLQEIDCPIPTLETFFKDRSYLEVGQSVMKQLYPADPHRQLTVDQRVSELFDTPLPVLYTMSQQRLGHDLLEFWRFSFQYGFELTDHQRRKALVKASRESTPSLVFEEPGPPDRMHIWGHFCQIIQSRGFRPPTRFDFVPRTRLPDPVACDFPEIGLEKDVEVEKRSGKPFSNTVEADRYALSAESLRQSWTTPQVTAGFLRRSVFKAFFSYLIEEGQEFNQGPAVHSTPIDLNDFSREVVRPNADVDIGNTEMASNLEQAPGSAIPVETFTALPTAIIEGDPGVTTHPSQGQLYFPMLVTIGSDQKSLNLPDDHEFMNLFQHGLNQHYFSIAVPDGRLICPDECYTYYLRHPAETLHAQYYNRESTITPESNAQAMLTDPPRQNDARTEMEQAKGWLNEIARQCVQNT